MTRVPVLFTAFLVLAGPAVAQPAPGGPPAVGVVRAERQQITQTDEFIGRIQAVGRVALVARVTAFLEKRLFVEGSEVKKGDLLYLLEQPPFQAQVDANKATVEQLEAQHRNAEQALERAQALLKTQAGRNRPSIARLPRSAPWRRKLPVHRRSCDIRDQSWLYRNPRADRRQDQQHRGHRRQRCFADERDPGDARQPGPNVRNFFDLAAHWD